MIDELLRRQGELQAGADAVVADLGLDAALAELGDPVRTGSSALGLMVVPDIDITVVCPVLDVDAVVALAGRLARHERVRVVQFRKDSGRWNTEPDAYPDGLYLGVKYRDGHGGEPEWNADIWFVDEPDRQPDLGHVRALPARITPEARAAILLIKHSRPDYRGVDVYRAVLEDNVRTPGFSARWRATHGQ
ncbi:hypothetical protein FHX81_0227 [Saccharothrix saharensis]|uniref:Nucleotidyltransferase-like protein n=1 Tax=Saccharothrix saharensis TaxID=571190 RepID=A0A543J5C3_9PSEU|nr:hypothetical protein [Saccharothrix saharensis]TQM77978.1 hypothetical protein FHX81_0227 [Saccharothrix saharensis]